MSVMAINANLSMVYAGDLALTLDLEYSAIAGPTFLSSSEKAPVTHHYGRNRSAVVAPYDFPKCCFGPGACLGAR
jgi:hypothetical protein